MQQEPWPALCADFGYDINNATNGLLLPTRMDAACQLTVARHAGNHDDTIGDGDLSYIDTIKAELRQIAQEAQAGIYCRQRNPLTWRLHILSRKAAVRIRTFTWTVTSDGLDYQPGGIGCAGATSLDKKSTQPCPCHRDHDLVGPDRNPLTPGSIP
jgi:hypothetical protein